MIKKKPRSKVSANSAKTLPSNQEPERLPILLRADLESKKRFLNAWVTENKIPGKIQAWFSVPSEANAYDWRIVKEQVGSHPVLKIETPAKGLPVPEPVLQIHEQIRKTHLRAFKNSIQQILFRPAATGSFGLLVQANLHGAISLKAYRQFLEFLQRHMADTIVCCHQIECHPNILFDPAHLHSKLSIELRRGFGKEFLLLADSEMTYHILDAAPRAKKAWSEFPEKLNAFIHPKPNDSILFLQAGSGFLATVPSNGFTKIHLADTHAFAVKAAKEREKKFGSLIWVHQIHVKTKKSELLQTAAPISAEWLLKFFKTTDNSIEQENRTVYLRLAEKEILPTGFAAAIAESKVARFILQLEDIDNAAKELRKIRREGYMLRKCLPLDLDPAAKKFELLFLFVPDRDGVLGNPTLQENKNKAIRKKERGKNISTTGFNRLNSKNKTQNNIFNTDIPHFIQQKRTKDKRID